MLLNFPLNNETCFVLLSHWCLFKTRKGNLATTQFIDTDRLILLLTPVRIRWTNTFKVYRFVE
jgi:hypothetical protein